MSTPQEGSLTPDTSEFESIDTNLIRVGAQVRIPIYDENDLLLLAAGQVLTPAFVSNLATRDIGRIKIHPSEAARLLAGRPQGTRTSALDGRTGFANSIGNAGTQALDAASADASALQLRPQGTAFAEQCVARKNELYEAEMQQAFVENQEVSVQHVEGIYDSLSNGAEIDTAGLGQITENALSDMAKDSDLFAGLGINPHGSGYPARHSWHVTTLAIAIGTQLKLDEETLRELAVGCLIHDSAMPMVAEELCKMPRVLEPVEFLEITKHPVAVFDLIRESGSVSNRSAFIAYQMHERCNGSGYPRGRSAVQIHFLSKVAAVADTYIALVSPRPHRAGLQPYYAMTQMVKSAGKGLFDSQAVRALLQTISLFPLGSYVELSDGRTGRVIRSNGEHYSRPVIEIPGGAEPTLVNLMEETEELTIARPIAELPAPSDVTQPAEAQPAE